MRTNFGDYRAKMAAEEKSAKLDLSKVKLTAAPALPKASDKVTFIKKSAAVSGAKDGSTTSAGGGFKFDFQISND